MLLLRLRKYLTSSTLLLLAAVTVAVVVSGGLLAYHAERASNPGLATVSDAIWWAVVTVTTVGYGDRTPITAPGRSVGVVLMIFGIGFLGLFTATVASLFIDRMMREGRGLSPVRAQGHTLICGWNDKGSLIINQLREETDRPIVILADLEERPYTGSGVQFVRGRPYTEEGLRKADVEHAGAAIVLADASEGPPADPRTVLTVLAVESIRPSVYTCVEVLDKGNVEHLRRAGANEILPTNALVGCLLARASLNPGIIDAINDVAAAGSGAEVYVISPPADATGKTFDQAIPFLRERYGQILIGLRAAGGVEVCPPGDRAIGSDVQLVVLALEPPAGTPPARS